MSETISDFERPGGVTPAVQWLIAATVGVYFLQLASPWGNLSDLLALSGPEFPRRWWTPVSYIFVHGGFWHLALNMVTLWMFGPRVERALSTRSFVYFYLWCGIGGAAFHLLFAHDTAVVGGSAAIVGVVLAYALRWPDEELYLFAAIPMKASWLAVWMIVVNVGMALASVGGYAAGSTTAWVAHAGGLAFAWLYLHAPAGTNFDRIRQHVASVPDEVDPRPVPKVQRMKRRDKPESGDEIVQQSNAIVAQRRPALPAPRVVAPERVDDVNALLDKISRYGIESLTHDERLLLEETSRRLRGR